MCHLPDAELLAMEPVIAFGEKERPRTEVPVS
jgi:hypothetical protein